MFAFVHVCLCQCLFVFVRFDFVCVFVFASLSGDSVLMCVSLCVKVCVCVFVSMDVRAPQHIRATSPITILLHVKMACFDEPAVHLISIINTRFIFRKK